MPKVPRYDRQVGTAPIAGAKLTPNADPASFGQISAPLPDLSGVTRLVQQHHDDAIQQADQLAVLDADNQLDAAQRAAETKARETYRGKDATAGPAAALEDFDAQASKVAEGMRTDRQRIQFQARQQARRQSLRESTEQFADGEHRRWDKATTDDARANRVSLAATATDPAIREQAIAEGKAIGADYGRRQGWDAEMLAQDQRAFTTQAHVAVLDGMLNQKTVGSADAAKAYLAAHRGEIDGAVVGKLDAIVAKQGLVQASQAEADRILRTAPNLTAALVEVRQLTGDLRDETQQRVEHEFGVREVARRQREEANTQTATNIVERTGDYDAIPVVLRESLSVSARSSLRHYAAQVAKGEPVVTDALTFYGLYDLAASDDPKDRARFAETNLLTLRHKLSDSDFQEIVRLQASVRKGDATAGGKLADYKEQSDIVNGALAEAGIVVPIQTTASKRDAVKTRIALFKRAVRDQVLRVQAQQGKPATDEQVQEITDLLIMRGTVAGSGDERRVFERRDGERLVLSYLDVPATERVRLADRLRAQGLPVTQQGILRLYRTAIEQTPGYAPPEAP